jgi:hypothetical protein
VAIGAALLSLRNGLCPIRLVVGTGLGCTALATWRDGSTTVELNFSGEEMGK